MRKYTVNKNGMDFTIMVSDGKPEEFGFAGEPDIERDISPVMKKGSKIAEVTMDYKKIPIFYGGTEKNTGKTILIPAEGPLMFIDIEHPNAEDCRKAFADETGNDIYMVETAAGRVFYEACSDMPEKKNLYNELGATITLEYRYSAKPKKKKASRF